MHFGNTTTSKLISPAPFLPRVSEKFGKNTSENNI
jgi:hypothetical protein